VWNFGKIYGKWVTSKYNIVDYLALPSKKKAVLRTFAYFSSILVLNSDLIERRSIHLPTYQRYHPTKIPSLFLISQPISPFLLSHSNPKPPIHPKALSNPTHHPNPPVKQHQFPNANNEKTRNQHSHQQGRLMSLQERERISHVPS